MLKPIFNYVGNKITLVKEINKRMPTDYDLYVEPFIGGGAVFWNRDRDGKAVINDFNGVLIEGYKMIKKIPADADITFLDNAKKVGKYYPAVEEFINGVECNSDPVDKLVAIMKARSGTFNSSGRGHIYKNSSFNDRQANLHEYKRIMRTTTIMNTDWKKVLKKYDGEGAFFYLDPPYEGSIEQDHYEANEIDYNEMAQRLKGMKGKFLMSINDSEFIREAFKDFKIETIAVQDRTRNANFKFTQKKADDYRRELFISNY